MHVNPKIKLRKRRYAEFAESARPQTKLRTDRKLPVLYYISYGYVFPHTNHHSKKSARADSSGRGSIIEVLNVKVGVFILLIFATLPECSQNQTAVSDTLRLLSDF
jgi:hypothetical protein